jgi:zinc protease
VLFVAKKEMLRSLRPLRLNDEWNSFMTANGTNRADTISSAVRAVLPNGLVALIQRTTSTPTVSVRGEVLVGAVHEAADLNGVAVFTGAALIRGTAGRSYQQIVAETEERGCSVNAGGGLHSSGFGGKALAEDLPLVLDVLAEMLMTPTFPAHEIERLRAQFLMDLRESEQETGMQASRAVRRMLYPATHPYSRLASGTPETVARITRDELLAFHRGYAPELTRIAIVGDVDPDAVLHELERCFGGWPSQGGLLELELPAVARPIGIRRENIPMLGKVQSDVIWAVPGLRRSDADYYPAVVGNMILGRIGMGGRMGENIREDQGLAYYAYSGFEADLGAGPWAAAAGVSPEHVEQAIAAILHEIARFCADGPSDEELLDARAYLTGSLVLGLETNDGIAGTLLAIERHDLGFDYITRYPTIINGVSREAIIATARNYLSTENYVLAVAGPMGDN